MNISVITIESIPNHILRMAREFRIALSSVKDEDIFALEYVDEKLQLVKRDEPKLKPICVDFLSGLSTYRRKLGGGKSQAIAKAVGLKKGNVPSVIDATAGLGRDAFVLASLGCRVHMIERSPIVALLLADGLKRAQADEEIGAWVGERLSLDFQDSLKGLQSLPFQPDAIYLDPMFADKTKAALVKKEMRIFKTLLGNDSDSGSLLSVAFQTAQKRVVVKRSLHADCLNNQTPDASVKTLKNRFDLYMIN